MNPAELFGLVHADTGLSNQEKLYLIELCKRPDVAKFLSGALGATLGVLLAKYKKLSKSTQVLLGLAGYGIGRVIYNHIVENKQDHRQFTKFNDKLNSYEMDTTRY